jgi:transcriptional regulator with XRE-family HTH domain
MASTFKAVRFGALVRRLREQQGLTQGLTQEQLAERSEVSATYIGFVERGPNVPTLTIVLQIASALDPHVSDLLRGL